MKNFLICLVLAGCSSAQFAPANVGRRYASRTPVENIDIFSAERPNRKFAEIGTATACCARDPNALIALLRKKAFESGGDGLIDFEFTAAGQAAATVIRFE
jgi:hypothetical protein